jgi:hypothetical protein
MRSSVRSFVHLQALLAAAALCASVSTGCCCHVPESIRVYAAGLPARADSQYALIDEDAIKKSLVLMDAMLACKIDEDDGKTEEQSPACQCAKSASPDWVTDCKGWLGAHTPTAAAPAPTAAPAPSAAPTSGPAPAPAPAPAPNG